MPLLKFAFQPDVPLDGAESTLHLAMFAVEGLLGQARVRLEAAYELDEAARTITVDAGSRVGRTICRIFTGFLLRESGKDAFAAEWLNPPSPCHRSSPDQHPENN